MVVLLTAISASSQTIWFKYNGNPVLDVGPSGSWDERHVGINRIIARDSIYQMWYSGSSDGSSFRMGYATSSNRGLTWTKYESNPVLGTGPESWDAGSAYVGYVIFADSTYKLWYSGHGDARWRMGYASSPDGITWTKSAMNPVLVHGLSNWDAIGVEHGSVLGPDSLGGFRLWYQGRDAAFLTQIGCATAANETLWTKTDSINPVLPLKPGTWESSKTGSPRVLYNGQVYEMWYGGSTGTNAFLSRIGYAMSSDGIHWTRSQDNPVIGSEPKSWESAGVLPADILLDGNIYYMWYDGYDGSRLRSGFAVSPKGTSIGLSKHDSYVVPGTDTIRISVQVDSAAGLSFSAEIESPDETVNEVVELFDDGAHDDSLTGDGLFANIWSPTQEKTYFVDLTLTLKDTLTFQMNNAGTFTTIGPLQHESHAFTTNTLVKDTIPNPGDTVLINLVLRNDGLTGTATLVTATLSTQDTNVTGTFPSLRNYPDVAPGATSMSQGYYWIFINPNCLPNTEIKLGLSIHSSGVAFWKDTVSLHVGGLVDDVAMTEDSVIPRSYSLSHNFPNPFNPSTTIQFAIRNLQFTSLKIFNIVGQEVATLVNEELKPGSYQVTWDAIGFASGVYFYRLTAGSFTETRKLVLVR